MRGGDSPRRESDEEMSDRKVTECLRGTVTELLEGSQ